MEFFVFYGVAFILLITVAYLLDKYECEKKP